MDGGRARCACLRRRAFNPELPLSSYQFPHLWACVALQHGAYLKPVRTHPQPRRPSARFALSASCCIQPQPLCASQLVGPTAKSVVLLFRATEPEFAVLGGPALHQLQVRRGDPCLPRSSRLLVLSRECAKGMLTCRATTRSYRIALGGEVAVAEPSARVSRV